MATQLPAEEIRVAWQKAGLDQGALNALRTEALEQFLSIGLPTTRLENWKYTNIDPLAQNLSGYLQGNTQTAAPVKVNQKTAQELRLTFVDGIYAPELSAKAELPRGVVLSSLEEFADSEPDRLQAMFGSLTDRNSSAMVALNTAFAGQGTVLIVPDNTELQLPLNICYISSRAGAASQPRLLVSLGKNSRATLLEQFQSTHPGFVNPVSELHCAEDSHLDYYKVQSEDTGTWHTASQYADLGTNATLHSTQIECGSMLARNELKINLSGRGAHAEAKGLFMADGKRHVESRIDVNHLAEDTTSRERFRSILADRARGVFNGRIYVNQDAQKTVAELTNRNLLLSKGAEINTKPELEIYADDVKCAHGATTGQLDSNSMFYLLTRGVDPDTARNMLITAFAAELLTDIKLPGIAEQARLALESLQNGSPQTDSTEGAS